MAIDDDPVAAFKQALATGDDQTILDRFYYGAPAAKLSREQEVALRRIVATEFDVAMRDVIITGSAKLGFTIIPKPGRPAFSPFSDTSDIDVAIISTPLFVSFWRAALDFASEKDNWDDINKFRKYLMRGWIRPDQLPSDPDFPKQSRWFEFFRSLTDSGEFGPYKIAAGVYYDEAFWEGYASSSITKCRQTIEAPL